MHLVFPVDVVFLALHFLKVKLGAGHPLVDVFNVVTGGLKVSGSIIGAGNEDLKQNHRDVRRGRLPTTPAPMPSSDRHAHLAFCSQVFWYEEVTDANESGGKKNEKSADERTPSPHSALPTIPNPPRETGRCDAHTVTTGGSRGSPCHKVRTRPAFELI